MLCLEKLKISPLDSRSGGDTLKDKPVCQIQAQICLHHGNVSFGIELYGNSVQLSRGL